MSCSSPRVSDRPWARRGTILPVAFLVLLVVGLLLVISSDQVDGVNRIQSLSGAKLQATYAAEAVAAQHEFSIVDLAATNDLDGLDNKPDPNYGTQWFGNCVVRWRIEPALVEQDPNASSPFTVNPAAGTLPPSANPALTQNTDFYTYRIATEAYYLADPDLYFSNPALYAPWQSTPQGTAMRMARVQCTRVMVINLVSLFKYAIFYGADGDIGDLEFWVGTGISVAGAVHSNGAIYIGGQGAGYLSPGNDYHGAASGGGAVQIGPTDPNDNKDKVPVVGVKGIYRMRKGCNLIATKNGVTDASTKPSDIPLDGVGGMTGSNNLNGDDPASGLHTLNGISFNSSDDSRSPLWRTASSPFGDWVRDQNSINPAHSVKSLSNIPELAGRPFEAQRMVGDGVQLYDKDGLVGTGDYTINPVAGTSKPVYSQGGTLTLNAKDASGNDNVPIYAGELPLFSDGTTNDLATAGPQFVPAPDPNTGLPTNEARGVYLNWALNGSDGGKTTGLTIRERGAQFPATFPFKRLPQPTDVVFAGDFAAYATAYAGYMASQYAVFLGGQDITTKFLDPGAAIAAGKITAFTLNEDQFHNRREAFWLTQHNYIAGDLTDPTGYVANFKVNALTLNIGNIQNFLKNTDWSAIVPGGSGKAKDKFDGTIYAHRTPRLDTTSVPYVYEPNRPWLYNPLTSPNPVFNIGGPPIYFPIAGAPIGQGPQVIPSAKLDEVDSAGVAVPACKAIRITQASDIDYGNTQPDAGNRPKGLTIITPNQCYLWKDFNATTHADDKGAQQITPCAVFADGVTALSNNWSDAQNQRYTDPINLADANGTTYTLSLVTNNVPTTVSNAPYEGSGAVANVVKFLELWSGTDFKYEYRFTGSLVVMNQQRYSLGDLGASQPAQFYSPPQRTMKFNTDLLTRAGQPPRTPFGVNVVRAISTVKVLE